VILMSREDFIRLVEQALDDLPAEFRQRIENVAVLVEEAPPPEPAAQRTPGAEPARPRRLILGQFIGVPTTRKSFFDTVPIGPNHIILYQKNIEAVCGSAAEIREQVRLTVIHELGHYFGMDESQLWDV
jgi:predicted Zn-dependent protease with MMP-like domain